jgi:hypothetical protein
MQMNLKNLLQNCIGGYIKLVGMAILATHQSNKGFICMNTCKYF